MKVVVTGARGFIGGHVVRVLESRAHDVIALDRKNGFDLSRHPEGWSRWLDGAESVIHLAARADVRRNWDSSAELDELWLNNEWTTFNVLRAARATSTVRSFVFVSTAATYAEPIAPYAATKLAGEAWCRAFAAKCGWELTIVRPAACYGRGYHHGHVADFVRQARATGRVRSLTRGTPRAGTHVEDLAEFLVNAATASRAGYVGGFCSGGAWGCQDTVRLMGVPADWGDSEHGWLGDVGSHLGNSVVGSRSLELGVREALASLGWEQCA